MMNRALLAIVLTGGVWAQTPPPAPSFEVASVKPAAPQAGSGFRSSMHTSLGEVRITNYSLKTLLMNAYDVKNFQIAGPDWLDSQRFDIVAKVPQGFSRDDVKLMLRGLLAERFKLTLHHESKDMQMYALVVSKRGLKLKESTDDPAGKTPAFLPTPGGPDAPPMPPPPPPLPGEGNRPAPVGRLTMIVSANRMRMSLAKESMTAFAATLGSQLQRPVTDMTGLKGVYDVNLDFAPDENTRPGGAIGMPMPPPPAGAEGAGAPSASDPAGPSLFTALEEQLGLKLEPKKGPVDILVIDHAEKTPTEN